MKTRQGYPISLLGSAKKRFDSEGPNIICVAVLK
jgi:hypothetical protein